MPSHAIPPGRAGRAHRKVARRRQLLAIWRGLPAVLVWVTLFEVAGIPASRGSAMSQVLDMIRAVVISALAAGAGVAVVAVLHFRMKAWRAHTAVPRPRWQYLLAAVGWLAVASCFVLVSLRSGTGLPARISAALAWWSGACGLVLAGRAAAWGRVRALLWWELG